MIKTFIYGNPHGFNLYEKDSTYNDYVKGFYISSRKGRRMMVNRRNNGETTYNYLRYGLREAIDRPTNAFFGMSLVVDGNQYCSDFHKILDWFDYIFDKIVKERGIFAKDEFGNTILPLKYGIHKFEEATADVEWIKSNLPNIFSSAAGTKLFQYDNSFVKGKTGQVSGLNDKETEENILKMFKKYSWITLSAEYELGVEKPVISELNYADLKATLDEFNKELVPIATAIATRKYEGNNEKLTSMLKESKESFGLLQNYLKTITDEKEGELFKGLTNDYRLLADSITALLSNISRPQPPLEPEPENTQYCFHCKQKKSPSQFRSPEATKCLDCEKEGKIDVPEIKIRCAKCGNFKTSEHFNKGKDICKECEQQPPQLMTCKRCGKKKPLKDFPHNGDTCNSCLKGVYWKELLHKSFIPMLGVLAVFIVLGGAYWFVFKPKPSQPVEDIVVIEAQTDDNQNKVSAEELNRLLAENKYNEAYQYINDKNDKLKYIQNIRDAIDSYLWSVIENSNLKDTAGIKAEIDVEIRRHSDLLLENLGLKEDYKNELYEGAKNFALLQTILAKVTITKAEYEKGLNALEAMERKLKQNWRITLDEKWSNSQMEQKLAEAELNKQEKEQKAVTAEKVTFTLTYTPLSTKKETTIDITATKGVDALVGTRATVKASNGTLKENNKASITLQQKEPKVQTVKCSNEIVVTVTFKKEEFVMEQKQCNKQKN